MDPGQTEIFLKERIEPLFREMHLKNTQVLLDILTFPLQKAPFKRVTSVWDKFNNETLLIISRRVFAKKIHSMSNRLDRLTSKDIRQLLNDWGDLPITSTPDIDYNCHPFITALNMQRMQLKNLTFQIENLDNLDSIVELMSEFEMNFLPDPLAKSFRTKQRDRTVIKTLRIKEIREYLNKGLPP